MAEDTPVYAGAVFCSATFGSGRACTHKAYFRLPTGALVCGVHNRRKPGAPLPPDPGAKAAARAEEERRGVEAETAKAENARLGRSGAVALARGLMMKVPGRRPGFIAVFPNRRAGSSRSPGTINARELPRRRRKRCRPWLSARSSTASPACRRPGTWRTGGHANLRIWLALAAAGSAKPTNDFAAHRRGLV